jgi:hypothetical protein
MRLEGLGQLKKKSNNLIGNRNHDLPACSIVPRPTTLPRALLYVSVFFKLRLWALGVRMVTEKLTKQLTRHKHITINYRHARMKAQEIREVIIL